MFTLHEFHFTRFFKKDKNLVMWGLPVYHFFRTLGAVCDKEGKTEFSLVFHELLKGDLSQKLKQSANITEDILPLDAPYTFPLPRELDCFSFKLSITTKAEWQKWDEEVDTAAALPRDIFACQVQLKFFLVFVKK